MSSPLVLVVDDSLTARMKLKELLEGEGTRVVQAKTAKEATGAAIMHRPNVVILDVVLPDGNGIDLCRSWRTNPVLKDMLVLLISGERSGHDDRIAGLRAGALGYATKPFSGQELLAQVGVLIRLNDTHSELRAAKEAADSAHTAKSELLEQVSHELMERKRAEAEAQRLRVLLKNIIDSMPSTLVAVDAEGRVTHWNRHAENDLELAPEDAAGQAFEKAFPTMQSHVDQLRLAMRDRQTQSLEKVESYTDNKKRFSDVMVYPLLGNGLEGAVVRVDDVTERVRLEEMMIQSEKMMSVGGLAAGMAHEINNPLAGIMQNIQVVLDRVSTDMPVNARAAHDLGVSMEGISAYLEERQVTSMLESVRQSGQRAAKIVENMLSFSRKSDAQVSSHDLSKLLDQTVELAGSDYDLKKKQDFKKIEIVREYEPSLPAVPCEGTKIQQVILNLLKNGAQAMAEIDDAQEQPRFVLRTRRDGDMARIEVEDNGPGMVEDIRKRIFEPFFTTKDAGTGTGLGLSVSYYIITEDHGGTMQVKSAPGRGARFVIQLPFEATCYSAALGRDT